GDVTRARGGTADRARWLGLAPALGIAGPRETLPAAGARRAGQAVVPLSAAVIAHRTRVAVRARSIRWLREAADQGVAGARQALAAAHDRLPAHADVPIAAVVAGRARVAVVAARAHRLRDTARHRVAREAGPVADQRRAADAAPVTVAAVVEGARIAVVARRPGQLVCAPLGVAERDEREAPIAGRVALGHLQRQWGEAVEGHPEGQHRRRHGVGVEVACAGGVREDGPVLGLDPDPIGARLRIAHLDRRARDRAWTGAAHAGTRGAGAVGRAHGQVGAVAGARDGVPRDRIEDLAVDADDLTDARSGGSDPDQSEPVRRTWIGDRSKVDRRIGRGDVLHDVAARRAGSAVLPLIALGGHGDSRDGHAEVRTARRVLVAREGFASRFAGVSIVTVGLVV